MTDNWTPNHRTAFQPRRKKTAKMPEMTRDQAAFYLMNKLKADAANMGKPGHYDIAFTQEDDGSMLLHWANCPKARQAAALGRPVATLYGCEILPTDTKRCECMSEMEG